MGVGAILGRRAAADPRLRVIHLPRSGGPGPARMRGLAAATGAYVWFADPDDLLTGGSLAAVADRLDRDRPDVLLLDYRILLPVRPDRAEPGGRAAGRPGLRGHPRGPARAGQPHHDAVEQGIPAGVLAGLGVTMPPGIHEDVPMSAACAAARGADRAAGPGVLPVPAAGSLLATPSMGHFSIFASYARVFALLDSGEAAAGNTGAVRAAVFGRTMEHYSSILANGLVPRPARRQFFGRMAADFRDYRPPGYQNPPGLRGLKAALISRDAYWAYTMLARANNARVTARRALARRG